MRIIPCVSVLASVFYLLFVNQIQSANKKHSIEARILMFTIKAQQFMSRLDARKTKINCLKYQYQSMKPTKLNAPQLLQNYLAFDSDLLQVAEE